MTIYDFLYLLTEDSEAVIVYDLTAEDEIFYGEARDLMLEDIADLEVLSFDLCRSDPRECLLILNVETEDE